MKQIIQKIRAVLLPAERRALTRHLLLGVLMSLLDILFLGLIVWLVNLTSGQPKGFAAGYLPATFIQQNIVAIAIGIIVLFGIKNVVGYFITQAQFRYSYEVAARLSNTRLMHYLQSDYFTYVNTDSSVYMYQIAQQPVEFSQYLLSGLQQIVVQATLILLSVLAILVYNTRLFLLVAVFILPPVLIVSYLIRKKIKAIRGTTRTNSEKSLQYLKESLSAYIESHIFDKKAFFSDRYTQYQQQLNTALANLQSVQLLPSRLFEVFAVAGVFMMMVINYRSAGNTVNLITVGVFMAAAYKIIPGLVKIITFSGQMKAYEHTLTNLEPSPVAISQGKKNQPADSISTVEFADVSFKYAKRTLFKNLNITLRAGDFAGINGISGKGKTSLINMLLGFLEPACGYICINLSIADKQARTAYRKRISYVKQSVLLIHDTILKNIVLTDGGYDKVRLNAALATSGLDELIKHYPQGIEKLVTENGNNLSGGQRQRIMLARALYKDFDLLILDEPFNELDEASELRILRNLKELTYEGKIVLFITHNQQSLAVCNKIIALDEIIKLDEA